jgi:hypothetical protein
MRYRSNIGNISGSRLIANRPVDHVTGGAVQATPDQLGVNITKSVFGWKYPATGVKTSNGGDSGGNTAANSYIDTYGLPFIFVVGGNQILLPPVVSAGGTPVPEIPNGLSVVWASSFMGVPIPSDFFLPVTSAGALTFNTQEFPSAQNAYASMTSRASGSWSNAVMLSNGVTTGPNLGETLLRLIMSVFECLIYSYSSYPWGNAYSDLSGAVMTQRDLQNYLDYPYQSQTFLGNVITQVAPVFINTVEPILNAAISVVATPLAGAAAKAGESALNPLLTKGGGAGQTQTYTSTTTQAVATGDEVVDTAGIPSGQTAATQAALGTAGTTTAGSSDTWIYLVGAIILIIFIIFIINE